eukprot:298228-Hanusia_phi.AAC.1
MYREVGPGGNSCKVIHPPSRPPPLTPKRVFPSEKVRFLLLSARSPPPSSARSLSFLLLSLLPVSLSHTQEDPQREAETAPIESWVSSPQVAMGV